MSSEGVGEMFERDFADKNTQQISRVSKGKQADPSNEENGERGPPSVRTELYLKFGIRNVSSEFIKSPINYLIANILYMTLDVYVIIS